LVVHAKHDEKDEGEGGLVTREVTRRLVIPDDVDLDTITSTFIDGLLTISAEKKRPEKSGGGVEIPIVVEKKKEEDGEKKLDDFVKLD